MRILLTMLLLTAALAGCTDDPETHDDGCEDAEDHDACHDEMDGGGGGAGGGGGTGDNETRETVQLTVTWSGAYAGPATGTSGAAYDKGTLTVPANSTVELTFVNDDPATGHDIAVEGFEDAGGDSATIDAGEEVTITFDVGGPQETTFYCTIPGHRANGMEGTFIVE